MKSTFYFLLFLLSLELYSSLRLGKTLTDSKEALSDDELIDFPLKELQGDCDDLSFFVSLICDSVKRKKSEIEKLKSAQSSVSEAKLLVLKIINVESKYVKKSDCKTFLQRNLRERKNTKLRDLKEVMFGQIKDEYSDLVDKLKEVYELVSSDCQNNMKEVNRILNTITPGEHGQNIIKCNNMMKILENIAAVLINVVDNNGMILNKLNVKKTQAELMITGCGCSE